MSGGRVVLYQDSGLRWRWVDVTDGEVIEAFSGQGYVGRSEAEYRATIQSRGRAVMVRDGAGVETEIVPARPVPDPAFVFDIATQLDDIVGQQRHDMAREVLREASLLLRWFVGELTPQD